MNPAFPVLDEAIELDHLSAETLPRADRIMLGLTVFGIAAALVAFITYDFAARVYLRPGDILPSDVVKPPLYYAAYGTQIVVLTVAGLFALLGTNLRQIERGFMMRFSLFILAALLMAVRGLSGSDFLSTKIADGTGLFPMLISVLMFVGARRHNWVVLEKIMFALAWLLCGLVIVRMAGLQTFTRQEGVANLGNFLNALLWPAAWVALRVYPQDSFTNRIKLIPVVIYALGSLFTQTRLNFVMVIALFAIYAFIQRKRGVAQAGLWIGMIFLVVWLGLITAMFLRGSNAFNHMTDVTSAFAERLDDDSRTEQVTAFRDAVAPGELILGRGSMAIWDWDGYEWRGGTDIGYLSLLFYGGIPLLLTYIAVHVKPCVAVLRRGVPDWRLAAAGVGALWGLRMFSSSYPGTSLDYYSVLFCIGAVISRV